MTTTAPPAPPVVKPAGVDFTQILPILLKLFGGNQNAAIKWMIENQALLAIAGPLLVQILEKYLKEKPKIDEAPKPITPPTPTPVPLPPVVPGTPTSARLREVSALVARWSAIETPKREKEGTGQRLYHKDEFDKAVRGSDPVNRGSRLHVDVTPIDQFGQPFLPTNDWIEEDRRNPDKNWNLQLLFRPDWVEFDQWGERGDWTRDRHPGQVQNDNHRMFHFIDGAEGELTNEYNDYGCTPVIKIPRDLPLEFDGSVTYEARFQKPDGSWISSNRLQPIRVKPWLLPA